MFNLLVQIDHDESKWDDNHSQWYDISHIRNRLFEYTATAVKDSFSTAEGPDLQALTALPCLFTYEGDDVVGRIGRIVNHRTKAGNLEIFYELPQHYPPIALNDDHVFESLGIVHSFERSRTHWAVKDIDLFEYAFALLHGMPASGPIVESRHLSRIWGRNHKSKVLAFLSHRAEHKSKVAAVKEKLEQSGVRCFVAHEDILPTLEWQ